MPADGPPPALAQEETLTILIYFHRPPFYHRDSQASGDCQGLVLERVCQALCRAEVAFTLVELPVKRVLQEVK